MEVVMKILKSTIYFFTVFAALLVIPSVLFAESEEKIEKVHPLSRDGKVYLENEAGDITVKSWQKAEIKILARKVARDKELLDNATVEINQADGNIRIITRHKNSLDFSQSTDVIVYYDLFVPDKAQLRVKSISGMVQTWEIGGRTDIETVTGKITVVKNGQRVKCKTISGEIYLEEITGNVALESTSGKIIVDDLRGSIEATNVSGDISVKGSFFADEITMETIKGNMEVQGELSPGGIYEFNTISGRIELVLPPASEFELRSNTINGNIQSDFELSDYAVYTRNKLQGVVGKGGSSLRMSSVSGDILIDKGI